MEGVGIAVGEEKERGEYWAPYKEEQKGGVQDHALKSHGGGFKGHLGRNKVPEGARFSGRKSNTEEKA